MKNLSRMTYLKNAVKSLALAAMPRAASSGVGFEIATSARTRKALGVLAGIAASADRHQSKHTLGMLREICRAYDRQSSLFSGILDRALDNIFGANFDFVPITGDKELNKQVKGFVVEKMEASVCDATGVRDFVEIAKTAIRAIWNDGDCLLAKRKDGTLLAFEADQIISPSASGGRIVLGVELNDLNRHIAYYVQQRNTRGDYGSIGRSDFTTARVPAQYALMPAYRKRFGQTRGIPFLAATLAAFDRTNNYLDYESLAAEINAMQGLKIKRAPTENDLPGVEENSDTTSTFEKLQKLEAGMIFDLLPGEDVDMFGSERPGSNFEPYIVTCCRIIGVGIGYPLELMMLDFSKTNYSSARASMGEARRMFRAWQKFAQKTMCLPWYKWQINRGIASGFLPANPDIFKVRCQWPAWEYIDPYKESQANKIAINSRIKSISQAIREQGNEPDEVFAEIAEDRKKLAELGVPLEEEQSGAVSNKTEKEIDDEDAKNEKQ